jgi:hypothetical protein
MKNKKFVGLKAKIDCAMAAKMGCEDSGCSCGDDKPIIEEVPEEPCEDD